MTITEYAINAPSFLKGAFVPVQDKAPKVLKFQEGVDSNVFFSFIASERADSIGIVCGKPSGVFCIDVDEQHLAGIAERAYAKFMTSPFYEDPRIVVEKTPGGGIHFWFRCESPGKTFKIASRLKETEEGKKKKVCFIESRGQGSMFCCYPSKGYVVITPNIYPEGVLTEAEQAEFIVFFKSFDLIEPAEKRVVMATREESRYLTSPFADYNQKNNVLQLLMDKGWRIESDKSDRVHLTRPGKERGVSGTWYKASNLFYCFTSSTDFEPGSTNSATDIALMDKYESASEMYRDIRGNYGVLSHSESDREAISWLNKRLLENSVTLSSSDIPEIYHPETKAALAEKIKLAKDVWPAGIFWIDEGVGRKIRIDRERLYRVCERLGFRLAKFGLVKIVSNPFCLDAGNRFIVSQTLTDLNKALKAYCLGNGGVLDAQTDTNVVNAVDEFIEQHFKHLVQQLNMISHKDYLGDSERSFKRFFRDCWVNVTPEGIETKLYSELSDAGFIPIEKYINFSYMDVEAPEDGLFLDFLRKAVWDVDYALQCIAYSVHDYKSDASAYMIGLIESTTDKRKVGGSGKNLWSELVSQLSPADRISGSMIRNDATLLQSWNMNHHLLSLDDMPKKFDFDILKELITGSVSVKKLFKDVTTVTFFDLPKVIFSTNFGVPVIRGDMRRRIRLIEFTDFFNIELGVASHYSKIRGGLPVDWLFPSKNPLTLNRDLTEKPYRRTCWDVYEWKLFFTTVFSAVQKYLAGGLIIPEETATVEGWEKNFSHSYGESELSYMREKFATLVGRTLPNADIYTDYVNFCSAGGIGLAYRKTERRHLEALREWAKAHNVDIVENVSMGDGRRGKSFVGDVKAAIGVKSDEGLPF